MKINPMSEDQIQAIKAKSLTKPATAPDEPKAKRQLKPFGVNPNTQQSFITSDKDWNDDASEYLHTYNPQSTLTQDTRLLIPLPPEYNGIAVDDDTIDSLVGVGNNVVRYLMLLCDTLEDSTRRVSPQEANTLRAVRSRLLHLAVYVQARKRLAKAAPDVQANTQKWIESTRTPSQPISELPKENA